MNTIIKFVKDIYKQRRLIFFLAKHEFIARYTGTLAGMLWAILHPLATIIVFWFVFSVGFKISVPGKLPFLLYFVCGLVPWLMFSEVINTSTNGIRSNLNLIKKTVFPSEIYPIVYILTSTVSHIVLFILILLLLLLHDIPFSLYITQVIFYYFCLFFLMTGICWILSALNVFHRDVAQGVPIMLNLWFWLTPLVWSIDIIPEKYNWILIMNPVVYVVEGYRNSLLYQVPFWTDITGGIYFFTISGIIFVTGAFVFHKFKMEFADTF